MKLPCRKCYYYESETVGHRTFVRCQDEEKKKTGFTSDNYFYNHTCDNQKVRAECFDCVYNIGHYCKSVMAFENGKCIDRKMK